jgi:hypothetical protein
MDIGHNISVSVPLAALGDDFLADDICHATTAGGSLHFDDGKPKNGKEDKYFYLDKQKASVHELPHFSTCCAG